MVGCVMENLTWDVLKMNSICNYCNFLLYYLVIEQQCLHGLSNIAALLT